MIYQSDIFIVVVVVVVGYFFVASLKSVCCVFLIFILHGLTNQQIYIEFFRNLFLDLVILFFCTANMTDIVLRPLLPRFPVRRGFIA